MYQVGLTTNWNVDWCKVKHMHKGGGRRRAADFEERSLQIYHASSATTWHPVVHNIPYHTWRHRPVFIQSVDVTKTDGIQQITTAEIGGRVYRDAYWKTENALQLVHGWVSFLDEWICE